MITVAVLLGAGFATLVVGSVVGAEWLMAVGCVGLFLGIVGAGAT